MTTYEIRRLSDYVSSQFTAEDLARRINQKALDYRDAKLADVRNGRETQHLAGLQLQKYLYGVHDVLRALDLTQVADLVGLDNLVAEVDPDWRTSGRQRWAMQRADVSPAHGLAGDLSADERTSRPC
jgi:hypothetical protein